MRAGEGGTVQIAPLEPHHWEPVSEIYSEGLATGDATFETNVPPWDEWHASHLPFGRIVALVDGAVAGWAALSPVSDRCVYGGVAEVSVYVSIAHRGRGVGSRLMQTLIEESEKHGVWTLQAGIFPENHESVGLHRKWGFREVGMREALGRLNGRWRDVLLLERRSRVVGVD